MSPFDVVIAPGVLGDRTTAKEIFARALAKRGGRGSLIFPEDETALAGELPRGARRGLVGYLPADPADLGVQGLQGPVIRVDLGERPADRSDCVREHIRGRGIDGLRFAVDVWHFRRHRPAVRLAYGADPDRHGDLRLPAATGAGRHPVAVLVHGGYWRSRWESDLMEPLAAELNARGYATWNLEYRRPDDHGWAATVADLAAGFAALARPDLATDLDLDRIALLGHSAGGQLAVRLAADLAIDPSAVVRPALTARRAGPGRRRPAVARGRSGLRGSGWAPHGAAGRLLPIVADRPPAHRLPGGRRVRAAGQRRPARHQPGIRGRGEGGGGRGDAARGPW